MLISNLEPQAAAAFTQMFHTIQFILLLLTAQTLWATWRLRRHRPFLFVAATAYLVAAGYAGWHESTHLNPVPFHTWRLMLGEVVTLFSAVLIYMGMGREPRAAGDTFRLPFFVFTSQPRNPALDQMTWEIATEFAQSAAEPTLSEIQARVETFADEWATATQTEKLERLQMIVKRKLAADVQRCLHTLRENPYHDWRGEVASLQLRWRVLQAGQSRLRQDRGVAFGVGMSSAALLGITLLILSNTTFLP